MWPCKSSYTFIIVHWKSSINMGRFRSVEQMKTVIFHMLMLTTSFITCLFTWKHCKTVKFLNVFSKWSKFGVFFCFVTSDKLFVSVHLNIIFTSMPNIINRRKKKNKHIVVDSPDSSDSSGYEFSSKLNNKHSGCHDEKKNHPHIDDKEEIKSLRFEIFIRRLRWSASILVQRFAASKEIFNWKEIFSFSLSSISLYHIFLDKNRY